jgi:hypothetical protein
VRDYVRRVKRYFSANVPSSGIAGWRGGLIERSGSEGTRPALLPAGPVPERRNVKSVFIETPDGQRLAGRWHYFFLVFQYPGSLLQCITATI